MFRRRAQRMTAGIPEEVVQSYWVARPGDRVMTREGFAGKVDEVWDGPQGGNETYIVTLDNGMGGGEYGPNEIRPLGQTQAQQASIVTAADDYPELAEILVDRPPLEDRKVFAHLAAVRPDLVAEQTYLMPPDFETEVTVDADGERHIVSEAGIFQHLLDKAVDHMGDNFAKNIPGLDEQYGPGHAPSSNDWCRFRRDSRCFYARNLDPEATKQAGYAVWIPEDRGYCPRESWQAQQQCPVSEPGPNVPGGYADATIPWEQGGQRGHAAPAYEKHTPTNPTQSSLKKADPEFAFHFTSAWRDVREKAARISREGHVRFLSKPDETNLTIVAEVQGDTDVYQTRITRVPGKTAVAFWECGCAWSAYSWGRSGRWKRFEGRMCSHALATTYAAQREEMFGGAINVVRFAPTWRDPSILPKTYFDKDKGRSVASLHTAADVTPIPVTEVKPGDVVSRFPDAEPQEVSRIMPAGEKGAEITYTDGTKAKVGRGATVYKHGALDVAPAVEYAQALLSDRVSAFAVLNRLATLGCPDPTAILKAAVNTHFPAQYDGQMVLVTVTDAGHTLANGAPVDPRLLMYPTYTPTLGLDPRDAAAKKEEGPTVSGVALKARDTGRVLMLQRGLGDEKDPAAGTWEFPGGHHEDGDQTSLHAGIREWEEEVGQKFPEGGVVSHTWRSPNGIYQGHVVVIPEEKAVCLHQGRDIDNPDDPDGDESEQVAWWDPDDARKNPALRKEVKTAPWDALKKAAVSGRPTVELMVYAAANGEPCPACSGTGEQGTGHECYACDSTGQASAYDPSIDNANPENGLLVGRNDAAGVAPVVQPVARYLTIEEARAASPYRTEAEAREALNQIACEQDALFEPGGLLAAQAAALSAAGFGTDAGTVAPFPPFESLSGPVVGDVDPVPPVMADALGLTAAVSDDEWAFADDPGALADLHDEPEPALPTTDGEVEGPTTDAEALAIGGRDDVTETREDMGLPPLESRNWLMNGARPGQSGGSADRITDSDIALVAKQALKSFTPAEQRELIEEGEHEGVMASNLDHLDIAGTHYMALEESLRRQESSIGEDEVFLL